ncbi:hypothetical protein CK203_094702 [Vitis vinifera]|uniref:Uncharacterized protein n=1 Tax=Vitis vinifera TaxID=29760 RepID=A0A438BWS4_VITVI|nr:hypothetical protein CK203_094702 [Vitis vinifera]
MSIPTGRRVRGLKLASTSLTTHVVSKIGICEGSFVQVLPNQGETGGLHPDLVCLFGILGQSACPEVPYNVVRPFLVVCLACFDSIASGGFCDGMVGLHMYRQQYGFFDREGGSYACKGTRSLETDRVRVRSNTDMMVSYSASLLEAGNPSRMACPRCSPVGDCSRSPTPDPDDREAPSTRKVHHSFSLGSLRWIGLREYSSTKSAITWPFMDSLGAGQLTRPPGGLGSRGEAYGRHFKELRPLAPSLNTGFYVYQCFVDVIDRERTAQDGRLHETVFNFFKSALTVSIHPFAPAFRISKKKGRSSSLKQAIKRPSATSLPVRRWRLHVPGLFKCQEGTDIRKGGMHRPGWSLLLVLSGSIGERLTGCHIGRFAHPCHVRPKMTLKGDKSCTTKNCTLRVTGPAWTDSTMSPKEVVDDPLNPDRIRPEFSRPVRLCPMWLTTDAYTRLVELPGSTRMRLTSKSPIFRDRMRASWCGCSIRWGLLVGKRLSHLWGEGPLVIPGRMELTRSRTDAARNNFCSFVWSHTPRQMGSRPPEVGHALIIGRSFSYDMERGVRAAFRRLSPSAFDQTALAGPEVWHFFPRHFWMLSGNQDLLGGCSVLMFAYVERSISIVPRRPLIALVAYIESHELSIMHDMIEGVAGPIVCGEFGHEESPWGLVMNDMRAERRGEHVVQPFADGANGWLIWEVSPSLSCTRCESELSSWGARCMGVCGSCGLTLHASGMAPAVPGYIDSGSGLEFATWPLER